MEDGEVGARTVVAVGHVELELKLDKDLATIHHQSMEEGPALEVPLRRRPAI